MNGKVYWWTVFVVAIISVLAALIIKNPMCLLGILGGFVVGIPFGLVTKKAEPRIRGSSKRI